MAGRVPQSAGGHGPKRRRAWSSVKTGCRRKKVTWYKKGAREEELTAASFVGPVGTVSDEVTLWVQLDDALPTVTGEGVVGTRAWQQATETHVQTPLCVQTVWKSWTDALWPTQ